MKYYRNVCTNEKNNAFFGKQIYMRQILTKRYDQGE